MRHPAPRQVYVVLKSIINASSLSTSAECVVTERIMVKLKSGPSIHGTLQNAIVTAINVPNYSFSLPKLSGWESTVSSSADEKQRLEFVGDAVMHLSVALYPYRLFPDAAPGLYTNIRSAVNTNATFTHLMVKAGAYELPLQSHSTKAAADSFEVIVLQHSTWNVALRMSARGLKRALVQASVLIHWVSLTTADRSIPFLSTKRHRGPLDPANTALLKKIRLSSGRSSPWSTLSNAPQYFAALLPLTVMVSGTACYQLNEIKR
ncbi:hypothetical protein J3R83DRAFT_5496 [Lanmaoa asiatica]|nr:hypothetical protein J3R83DRAFT_5496 [Lanmaoa asiatica]